ncbi:MAG: methyl-accepting chemotaxis protein [Janthinobacterium lividum]
MSALDALRTNVMIASPDLTIIYMNATLNALMQEAEAELKAELPNFDATKLIGSNIDVFHKKPSHQRGMLAKMEKTHSATINVGGRVFDLIITPIVKGGVRLGFVVEWSDARARLLNVDYAARMIAIGRTQAVVEFDVSGHVVNANKLFLDLIGYSLAEIKGKHHSIFVDPAERLTPGYAAFWAKLNQGQYHAARFKRMNKQGVPVWIQGSYNPIHDEAGQVIKIVKYASDVTSQAELLEQLYKDFEDIDQAVLQSEAEGRSASTAADATLERVQTVAAGTEELASSIRELTGSMARTQTAADQAFERAAEVNEITVRLTEAARAMTGIVDLIDNVAGQINLLALNATIEAARAGDAGRGFAVVASEVKNLAKQSADAAARIGREIEGLQATSGDVAGASEKIREAIGHVREYVTLAALAMEQQNVVTASISSDMQSASQTVSTAAQNIGEISTAVTEVAKAVARTKEAAKALVA